MCLFMNTNCMEHPFCARPQARSQEMGIKTLTIYSLAEKPTEDGGRPRRPGFQSYLQVLKRVTSLQQRKCSNQMNSKDASSSVYMPRNVKSFLIPKARVSRFGLTSWRGAVNSSGHGDGPIYTRDCLQVAGIYIPPPSLSTPRTTTGKLLTSQQLDQQGVRMSQPH